MNHQPSGFRSSDIDERPLTRRAQAKLETRDKVLQAAKRLFISRGYESATIRDIAAEAGMSTGAVFANFTDKTDLFHAVLSADLDAQIGLVRGLIDHPGPVEEALASLFSAGYELHLQQLPLLQAATSLSWTEGLEGRFGERPTVAALLELVTQILNRSVARGELGSGADTRLMAEMLWDAYISNYRRALFDNWGLQQLNARFAELTAIILSGARQPY
jgi:AcrR family transcriptional regulator